MPDFALLPLDYDLANLANLAISLPGETQHSDSLLVTPYSSQILHDEQALARPIGGLINPSSNSGDHGDAGGFIVHSDDGRGTSRPAGPGSIIGREDDGFLPDAGFGFDAEGNLLEFTPIQRISSTPAVGEGRALGSDAGASAKVRKEHEEGLKASANVSCLLSGRSSPPFQLLGVPDIEWFNEEIETGEIETGAMLNFNKFFILLNGLIII